MSEQDNGEPLSRLGFGQHLMWMATKQTAAFFGVKGGAVAVGILVLASGGIWHFAPRFFVENSFSKILIAVLCVFVVYLLFGSHGIYAEEFEKRQAMRHELESLKTTLANPTFVRRIMDNFAHYGHRIAMSGPVAEYDRWIAASETFVRRTFVASHRDDFLLITAASSTGTIFRDSRNGRTTETKQLANMIMERVEWLEDRAKSIQESHIVYGCTEANLMEWINWTPTTITTVPRHGGTITTTVFVRRIMEHLSFAGANLEGEIATKWRADALEFARLALTPQKIVDFELPDLTQHHYTHWLRMIAPKIEETDINPGVTDQQLTKWLNWIP